MIAFLKARLKEGSTAAGALLGVAAPLIAPLIAERLGVDAGSVQTVLVGIAGLLVGATTKKVAAA